MTRDLSYAFGADHPFKPLNDQIWAVNAALRHLGRNGERMPEALHAVMKTFFLDHVKLPLGLDMARVLRAQHWAQRQLFPITVTLFCAALPAAYAAARGARVLSATGRMAADLDRRVNETARFVLDVLSVGSLAPDGRALSAIRRTRWVHASVRSLLAQRAEFAHEVPINQEDLLGTLLGFSALVVRSLRRLGIEVSARDAEDFLYLWRAVGQMLGLEPALSPADFDMAEQALAHIAQRQFRASPHGQALTAALLRRMEEHVSLPGLRGAPRFLVRYLLGDHTAELLGVDPKPTGTMDRLALRGLVQVNSPDLWAYLSPRLGQRLLESVVSAKLSGHSAPELRMKGIGT